ncbi:MULTISPECIES: YebF family protein [Pectobacterium]|uniref:Uncharacterized protein n=1 Tax=Pectobacterium carotovorum subsp. carotovorum (strain PC1) TaxID=561230 RepID=C6DJ68_PECCP|nr:MULTISPECIES: YebF family protein [Pectobacterium]ACT13338.1 hypothetical protein PC1_2302 [Pectobacterium carotovorum subsp. carotovorum PC1]MBA5235686.1 hypothetical protein [Pectobacterium aroidearum]QPI41302.1 hypothetical protein I2D83_12340 [Pectobacterium aroidearum]UUE55878.1 protein YebF [Pectobacterium aroidearum]UUE68538.1 protein YebF [Pectobacterium aroidearum]
MGWKKKAIFSVLITVVSLSVYKYYSQFIGPSCDEITYEQVVTNVQDDLIEHRIPRWLKLRPTSPDIAPPDIIFDKENTSRTVDVYLLPVTVSYPKKSHQLFAMYECKSGSVEYSVKN